MQRASFSLPYESSAKKQHLRYISVENSTKITSTTITTTKIVRQPSHLQQLLTFFKLAEIYQNPKRQISTKIIRQKNPDTLRSDVRVMSTQRHQKPLKF